MIFTIKKQKSCVRRSKIFYHLHPSLQQIISTMKFKFFAFDILNEINFRGSIDCILIWNSPTDRFVRNTKYRSVNISSHVLFQCWKPLFFSVQNNFQFSRQCCGEYNRLQFFLVSPILCDLLIWIQRHIFLVPKWFQITDHVLLMFLKNQLHIYLNDNPKKKHFSSSIVEHFISKTLKRFVEWKFKIKFKKPVIMHASEISFWL